MKRTNVILLAVGASLATLIAYVVFSGNAQNLTSDVPSAVQNEIILEPKMDETGAVAIAVAPKGIFESSESWDFEISLNTHSIELSEDMVKVATLFTQITQNGEEYRAIEWEGSPPGGHHREGSLKFRPISPMPASIALEIYINGERKNFEWALK